MKTLNSMMLAACLLSPAVAFADTCRHSRDIDLDIDAAGLERIMLETGAGHLVINQAENAQQVIVRARACADSLRRLEGMDIEHNRRGNSLAVITRIEDTMSFSPFSGDYAWIDVDIEVPPGLVMEIDDGSGDIRISDYRGDVEIEDGSGSIDIDGVEGSIRLVDGSGNIDARNVAGDVHIPSDGSGSIRIREVRGNVVIDDDGSGSISVHNITGDLEVGDSGSSGIDYGDIGGSVRL